MMKRHGQFIYAVVVRTCSSYSHAKICHQDLHGGDVIRVPSQDGRKSIFGVMISIVHTIASQCINVTTALTCLLKGLSNAFSA